MDEAMAARYWCYMCSQMVNPIMEVEIKCPFCQSGFVEERSGSIGDNQDSESDFGSDRALSLWAPILLGMMGNLRRHGRLGRMELEEVDDDNVDAEANHGGEIDFDRQLESILRRRRNSTTIMQLLQGIRAGRASESENYEGDRGRDREREGVILINPFNQTIIVQGSYDSSNGQNQNQNRTPTGSLGDYFIGPGLDLLLEHLAENDPNRYGTPPAQKEAIEALPTVTMKETLQCSVCLDDFEIGTKAKEMPCKHKFHSGCIYPWLELHSSCPVCRSQLPADETKLDSERYRTSSSDERENNESDNIITNDGSSVEDGDGEGRNGSGSGRRFSIPWPFNGLFSSSSGSQSSVSTTSSSSSSSANVPSSGTASERDEN